MKDEIVKVIAEYFENETNLVNPGDNRIVVDFGVKNPGYFTHAKFCQEIAAEITEKLLPIIGKKDFPHNELFDHMAKEHGLTLIQGELGDIIHIAREK